MTEKTLWIHAGGPKTGSSALQLFFDRNYPEFMSFDFAYENRMMMSGDHDINSGNGLWLYDELSSPLRRDNRIDEIVSRHFGGCNNAICSSEFFSTLDGAAWRELFRSSLRLGISLKIIYYVRNAVPLLLSGYDQSIKRQGESKTFSDWVKTSNWQHPVALRLLAKEIPISDLRVLSYDQNETNLIQNFLTVIGLDSKFILDSQALGRRVNRSLTADEREILIRVNSSMGETLSAELSDLLIYANPSAQAEPATICEETKMQLVERFGLDADWVNTTFFQGRPVVSVLPSIRKRPEENAKSNQDDLEHRRDLQQVALSWAIEKLRTIKTEATIEILGIVNGGAMKQTDMAYMGIPIDFDPGAYLVLNPDLRDAGVDPFRHFIDHGRYENRPIKFGKIRGDVSPEEEIKALRSRIEVLEQLLRQSVIVSKETLSQANRRERELSSRLALETMRNKAGYFSGWFRRRA